MNAATARRRIILWALNSEYCRKQIVEYLDLDNKYLEEIRDQAARSGQCKLSIVFGSGEAETFDEKTFDTHEEMMAYLDGVEDMEGFMSYRLLDDDEARPYWYHGKRAVLTAVATE
jgi:hypothetical protein